MFTIRRSARLSREGVGPEFFEPQVNLESLEQSPVHEALPPEHKDVLEQPMPQPSPQPSPQQSP